MIEKEARWRFCAALRKIGTGHRPTLDTREQTAPSQGGKGAGMMNKIILAAAVVLSSAAAAFAQTFDLTVMQNVYSNPASGCGYGFGYSGPGCPVGGYYCSATGYCYYRFAPTYHGSRTARRYAR
jgi:hypothetical protein